MKLSHKSLQKLIHGAYRVEKKKSWTVFYHFSQSLENMFKKDAFWSDRTSLSSSITLEFKTYGTEFSFDYFLVKKLSNDSIDVWVNGVLEKAYALEELPKKGRLEVKLGEGEKNVCVYFPIDSEVCIKNLVILGKYRSIKKGAKVLWVGDSITQGYGTNLTSFSYVNVANRDLNYEVLNQGIGGYIYDADLIEKMPGYNPDKIIVSFGTNHYRAEDFKQRVVDFYDKIKEVYGDIPVLSITPIWRGDFENGHDPKVLHEAGDFIRETVKDRKNHYCVDGFTLVPNVPQMYLDNLHPNSLGGGCYGKNLVKAIKKLKF